MSYQQLSVLYELQEIDIQIAKLQSQRGTIPVEIKHLEAKFLESKNGLLAEKSQLEDMEQQVSQKNKMLEQDEDQLKKYRSQRSAIIDSEREYKALERQISNLEKKTAATEDEILELMLSIDEKVESLGKHQTEIAREEAEYQNQLVALKDTDAELTAQIKEQMQNRKAYYDKIEGDLLTKYDDWRTYRGGFLLAPVTSSVCGGCNMTLRPQTINEIRKGEGVITCSICGRILLYMPEDEPDEDGA